MRVRHHRQALEEVTAAALYYEEQEAGLGDRFLEAYKAAIGQVKSHPEAYRIILDEMHRHLIERFPFALIYEHRAEEIVIIAVAHLKRRPYYWADRK
jgi:hypothetical protein